MYVCAMGWARVGRFVCNNWFDLLFIFIELKIQWLTNGVNNNICRLKRVYNDQRKFDFNKIGFYALFHSTLHCVGPDLCVLVSKIMPIFNCS